MKFWDLVLHRYANPFPIINNFIICGGLADFIRMCVNQDDEDKMWQLYLSRALIEEKSFVEWKQDMLSGIRKTESRKETTQEDAKAAVQHAENILANFKPF